MANHLRRQIREAVGTAVTGLTTTGSRVFQSRVYPAQSSDLPCLLVASKSETVEVLSIHYPRSLQRTLQLEIIAVAKATADLDDTLDGICKEVEIALANPVSGLASLARTITMVSTEMDYRGTAEKPVGSATMLYEVDYFAVENAPDAAL